MEDIKSKGFYCSRQLSGKSAQLVLSILDKLGIRHLADFNKYSFHCSIIGSSLRPFITPLQTNRVSASVKRFKILGNCLVLELSCPKLAIDHNNWKKLGCQPFFSNYIPHITLIENISLIEQKLLRSILNTEVRGNISLLEEQGEPLQSGNLKIPTILKAVEDLLLKKYSSKITTIQLSSEDSYFCEVLQLNCKSEKNLIFILRLLSFICSHYKLVLVLDVSSLLCGNKDLNSLKTSLSKAGFIKNENTSKIAVPVEYYKLFDRA